MGRLRLPKSLRQTPNADPIIHTIPGFAHPFSSGRAPIALQIKEIEQIRGNISIKETSKTRPGVTVLRIAARDGPG